MTIMIRSAIISLVVFYLFVFYLMTHPNVSADYRDYYILKSTDLTVKERARLSAMQLGQEYAHKDAAIGFDKWSGPEEAYRWNDGKRARLVFRLDSDTVAHAPTRLVLSLMPHGTQRTGWRLNGNELGTRQITSEGLVTFPLKPGMLRSGENVIEIDLPDAHQPNDNDGRALGVAFKSLRLE
ncbi:hypothetical protein ACSUZJ_04885 [Telluria sp. B2]